MYKSEVIMQNTVEVQRHFGQGHQHLLSNPPDNGPFQANSFAAPSREPTLASL